MLGDRPDRSLPLGYVVVIGLVALSVWVGSELTRRARRQTTADDAQYDGDAKIAVRR